MKKFLNKKLVYEDLDKLNDLLDNFLLYAVCIIAVILIIVNVIRL